MAESIREAYIRRNPKSAALYPRFKQIFPSGGGGHDGYVTSPSQSPSNAASDLGNGTSMATNISIALVPMDP